MREAGRRNSEEARGELGIRTARALLHSHPRGGGGDGSPHAGGDEGPHSSVGPGSKDGSHFKLVWFACVRFDWYGGGDGGL